MSLLRVGFFIISVLFFVSRVAVGNVYDDVQNCRDTNTGEDVVSIRDECNDNFFPGKSLTERINAGCFSDHERDQWFGCLDEGANRRNLTGDGKAEFDQYKDCMTATVDSCKNLQCN